MEFARAEPLACEQAAPRKQRHVSLRAKVAIQAAPARVDPRTWHQRTKYATCASRYRSVFVVQVLVEYQALHIGGQRKPRHVLCECICAHFCTRSYQGKRPVAPDGSVLRVLLQ